MASPPIATSTAEEEVYSVPLMWRLIIHFALCYAFVAVFLLLCNLIWIVRGCELGNETASALAMLIAPAAISAPTPSLWARNTSTKARMHGLLWGGLTAFLVAAVFGVAAVRYEWDLMNGDDSALGSLMTAYILTSIVLPRVAVVLAMAPSPGQRAARASGRSR